MKILFVGGTGLISTAISDLVVKQGHILYILNRGTNNANLPKGVKEILCDVNDKELVKQLLSEDHFDSVVDFIAFTVEDIKRDLELFTNITDQYIFISSASAYQKPATIFPITEEVPLGNPFWEYSENKRLCEEYLLKNKSEDLNVTIIRPSHTYNSNVLSIYTFWMAKPYTLIDRILNDRPIVIPGDGTSLWTITHNSDFAEFFTRVLGNEKTYNETYHITSDFIYTWDQIIKILASALHKKAIIKHIPTDFIVSVFPHVEGELIGDKSCSTIFDNSKIKSIYNHKSLVRYEDVINEIVAPYLKNKDLQEIDEGFNSMLDKIISEYEKKK